MKSAQILSVSVDQLDKHAIETQFEMQTNRFSLSVITQEAQNDQDTTITEEQVGFINMLSLIFCCCFPFTGIFSLVYASLTRKHFEHSRISKARECMNRAEWLLIVTIFGGIAFLSGLFLLMLIYTQVDEPHARRMLPTSQYHIILPK